MFKHFSGGETTPETLTYYYKLVPQLGDSDIIDIFITSEGQIDADPVLSGHAL